MHSHTYLRALSLTAFVTVACSDPSRPSGIDPDASVILSDIGSMTVDLGAQSDSPDPTDSAKNPADTQPSADTTTTLDAAQTDGPTSDRGTVSPDGAQTDGPPTDTPTDRADAHTGPPVMRCAMTRAERANLAVRLATCLNEPPQSVVNRFFQPDTWEGGPIAQRNCGALRCALTARTCSDITSGCLKYTTSPATGGTCGAPTRGCVAVRFATSCANGVDITDDCEATGQRCVASSTQALCVPMTSMTDSCTDGAPPRCAGNRLQHCVLGTYANIADCDQTNTRCDATADACTDPSGPSCTDTQPSCDGTRLRTCRGGHLTSIDCALINTDTVCQTRGGSFCGIGTVCDPAMAPQNGTCEGNTLVVCAGGQPFRFDCTSAGFTGCGTNGCTP